MKEQYKEASLTDSLLPATKPTLLTLRREHDIASQTLADAAGVSLTDLYVMEIGGTVQEAFAIKVLAAFSKLAGTTYRLNDISVSVKRDRAHDIREEPRVSSEDGPNPRRANQWESIIRGAARESKAPRERRKAEGDEGPHIANDQTHRDA